MKIGIFGGSFNPPHNYHEEIANTLLKEGYLDKVIFVPTGIKYEYKNNLEKNKHRYNMLKIIANKNKNLSVSRHEFTKNVTYTYSTLDYFRNKYKPTDEIYFICGTDNLSYIDKWQKGEYLLKNYKFLIINRLGNDINELLKIYQKYRKNIIPVALASNNISSTLIRKLLLEKNYQELELILDKDVLNYIKENKLYENKKD